MRLILSLGLLFVVTSAPAMGQWQLRDGQGHPITPGPNYAAQGEFGTQQISTTDPERLQKAWAQKTPGVEISTQDEATRNQPIFTFVIFRGCKAGPDGHCHVSTRFDIVDPAGKPYGTSSEAPVWDDVPPPPGNLQLSRSGSGMRIEDGEQLGKYRVIAKTTDHVANITLTTEAMLTIAEAPVAGGWSAVAAPADNADVRAAADAMLQRLPAGHAGLGQIDTALRQVVAGTNYRLTLRLTDGSKWGALVWHKLDGSFVVSDPVQVR